MELVIRAVTEMKVSWADAGRQVPTYTAEWTEHTPPGAIAEKKRVARGIFDLSCLEYPHRKWTLTEETRVINYITSVVAQYDADTYRERTKEEVKAGLRKLRELRSQHGEMTGTVMYMTGMTAEELRNVGGISGS